MKAHTCDYCGKLIKDSDIRVILCGYEVLQNRHNENMPKGFAVKFPFDKPDDFCSFTCLSEWLKNMQPLLDEYNKIVAMKDEI